MKALADTYAAEGRPLHRMTETELDSVLRAEIGQVFRGVLENCGVFKRDDPGRQAFSVFISAISA